MPKLYSPYLILSKCQQFTKQQFSKNKKLTYTVPVTISNVSALGGNIGNVYLSSNNELPDNIIGYSIESCYYSANQSFVGTASIYNNEELIVNSSRSGNYTVGILCLYT